MSDLHRFAVRNATANMQASEQRTSTASARTPGASHGNNMLSMPTITTRPEFERSSTWPTPKAAVSMEPITEEDDIDQDPQQHFLSPVQSYEWQPLSDDDDDNDDWDGSEIQWDAGITDFALFDNDRREADKRKTDLPPMWHSVASNQEQALQRSLRRTTSQARLSDDHVTEAAAVANNNESDDESDDPPSLTPDTSPDLRDTGDEFPDPPLPTTHSLPTPSRPQFKHKRNYRTVEITPPLPSEASIQEVDELPIRFHAQHLRVAATKRPVQRPGLSHARTLSGRRHSWRKPSWEIYALEETAEEDAEGGAVSGQTAALGK